MRRFRAENQTPISRAHRLRNELAAFAFLNICLMFLIGGHFYAVSNWLAFFLVIVEVVVIFGCFLLGYSQAKKSNSNPDIQLLKACVLALAIGSVANATFSLFLTLHRPVG